MGGSTHLGSSQGCFGFGLSSFSLDLGQLSNSVLRFPPWLWLHSGCAVTRTATTLPLFSFPHPISKNHYLPLKSSSFGPWNGANHCTSLQRLVKCYGATTRKIGDCAELRGGGVQAE